MGQTWLNIAADRGNAVAFTPQEGSASALMATWLAAAHRGEAFACHDLGLAFWTGSHGAECDLIEAHRWFNLAAVRGHAESQLCRAQIAAEMSAREIAEAQRRARAWIATMARRAA